MSQPTMEDLALRLRNAYVEGQVPPLRDGLEPWNGSGAYAVQALNTKFWVAQGRKVVGRKVGLTAKAVQTQLGVDQPDYGVLFNDMEVEDGGVLAASECLQPRAEAEVAVVLGSDIDDPDLPLHHLVGAIAYAVPAIEIVDSRISDWKITFADTVADNGSSAFFVLGKTPRKLDGLDLRTCGMALEFNGDVVSLGAGVACLGHPLTSAAWLARTLARVGEGLKAGEVILTGALGPMVELQGPALVRAEVGGLGACGFHFKDDR